MIDNEDLKGLKRIAMKTDNLEPDLAFLMAEVLVKERKIFFTSFFKYIDLNNWRW